ncbi:hypothetical protein MMC28_010457 [Mycoblastus sanguinarius]|nr:hypothetical protein [Mycoblastus sanguinarius]
MILGPWTHIIALCFPLARGYQVAKSGQYSVVNCGENTVVTLNALDFLSNSLLPAIQDVNSIAPGGAYQTFFKDVFYASYVSAILTNISTGTAIFSPSASSYSTGSPSFFCVTGPNQLLTNAVDDVTVDEYTQCLDEQQKPIGGGKATITVMRAVIGTPFIIICPVLWSFKSRTTPPVSNCLTINTSINRFHGDGQDLLTYLPWMFLHEIVHIYVEESLYLLGDPSPEAVERYDVNKCVRLSALNAVGNAQSYCYHVANIFGQCSDFPSQPGPRPPERQLLDANDPSDDGPDIQSLDAADDGVNNVTVVGQNSSGGAQPASNITIKRRSRRGTIPL